MSPGPGAGQADLAAAGVGDEAGGGVQQPVAQRLRAGFGQPGGQARALQPSQQGLGGQGELEPASLRW